MAIYHFSSQIISRSAGRSACAAAAYRSASEIYDERTGVRHDYTRKGGVLDSAVLAPNRAPDWARDRETLWNMAEAAENRKDAQVARETVIALPHELSLEENRNWLHGFVQEAYVKRGMAAQVDIHSPNREGSDLNYHAHVLLTMRQVTRNGFKDKKTRSWNEKATLQEWREQCAEHMNQALERAGHKERVDHRSYADQGVEKMATKHLGVDASQMERRKGQKTRIGDENRQAECFNRELEQMQRELRIIDGAIEEEKQRLAQEKSLRKSEKEIRAQQSFASELDYERRRGEAEQRARIKLEDDLKILYRREEAEQALAASQAQLAKYRGWFWRLVGRTAAAQDQVRSHERNLENIRQRESEARAALARRLAQESQRPYSQDLEPPSPALQREKNRLSTGPPGRDGLSLAHEYNAAANDNASDPAEVEKQRRIDEIERRMAQNRDRGRGGGMER